MPGLDITQSWTFLLIEGSAHHILHNWNLLNELMTRAAIRSVQKVKAHGSTHV